jgi:peroxiredoxin
MNLHVFAPLALLGAGSLAALPSDDTAPALADLASTPLLELDGTHVTLGDVTGDGVLVLTYTGVGCPISGKYAPRLSRIAAAHAEHGVRFVGINANPQDSREDIAAECEELGLDYPVLRDHRQELTRRLDARTTTEVYVFDAQGDLRYRGAVDDQYSLGASKPEPTRNYLVDALAAVLEGEEPEHRANDAPGCLLTLLPEEELPEAVTYSEDIAPILRSNCEVCHRPGQVGPFGLQTYEQTKGWGKMIASVVEEGRMPPWNASEEFHGVFTNERRLRPKEKATILAWVEDGMPQGDPEKVLPPAEWPDGWRLGEPDAVFEMESWLYDGSPLAEEGYRVPREGTVDYQYFTAQTSFPEDRWVQATEIRSSGTDVVHHVLVAVHDPKKGPFRGEQDLINYLSVAVPGDTPSVYPDGYAKLLPAGATLVFQLHYTPNGKERFDRSSIGLTFAEEEPYFVVQSNAVINRRFAIPPGADDYEVRGELVFEQETGLIALFPHMHTRGKDFRYIAHYPDGRSEDLLYTEYDFNWQEAYIYRDPLPLPAGTRLECIAHYDNSDGNPNNPDPGATVHWGDQSWEEMFVGYYDHVVPLD